MKHKLTISNGEEEKIVMVKSGTNLLKLLYSEGYNLSSPCGGEGICGKCKVRLAAGEAELTGKEKQLLSEQEISNGYRLSCQIEVAGELTVELENEEEITVLTEGSSGKISLDPSIHKVLFNPSQPSLTDQQDYLKRIMDGSEASADRIFDGTPSLQILQELAEMIRPGEAESLPGEITTTLKDGKIIRLEKGDQRQRNYGIAVDIGTTTIALYLLDLTNGKRLDVFSLHNPQKKFGADVISRVNYSLKETGGLKELQQVLVEGLNRALKELCNRNGLETAEILQMTVVGNTIMLHSLLGITAAAIARTPYVPVFTSALELRPEELGLEINSSGTVALLPSVSGYIGADIIGDLLAADFSRGWNLLIDIGTNGEIVLGTSEKLYACSAAAGPAFEGAGITFGMAGVPGAISSYCLNNHGRVEYETIGGKSPRGICGSGLVDIIATLLRGDFLTRSGALVEAEKLSVEYRNMLIEYEGLKAFQVVPSGVNDNDMEIVLTQKDIREFQLARGAISAGIEILLNEAGIAYHEIENVYLAGGFGNFIDPESACTIGLIPGKLREKIVRIGNGAGTGAQMYLLDKELQKKAEELKDSIVYIELSSRSDFQERFMESMIFPGRG